MGRILNTAELLVQHANAYGEIYIPPQPGIILQSSNCTTKCLAPQTICRKIDTMLYTTSSSTTNQVNESRSFKAPVHGSTKLQRDSTRVVCWELTFKVGDYEFVDRRNCKWSGMRIPSLFYIPSSLQVYYITVHCSKPLLGLYALTKRCIHVVYFW